MVGVDFGGPTPVESVERVHSRQAGGSESSLGGSGFSGFGFAV